MNHDTGISYSITLIKVYQYSVKSNTIIPVFGEYITKNTGTPPKLTLQSFFKITLKPRLHEQFLCDNF